MTREEFRDYLDGNYPNISTTDRRCLVEKVNKEFINQWVSVKDSLPESAKDVLISYNNEESIAIGWFAFQHNKWLVEKEFDAEEVNNVTHWMPLPEAPKMK